MSPEIDATVRRGRVTRTPYCSHPDSLQTWQGCSFCADAQREFDAFVAGGKLEGGA